MRSWTRALGATLPFLLTAPTHPASAGIDRARFALDAEFVLIPAGEYVMGTARSVPGARPQEWPRRVLVTRPFRMQTTEVTRGQWTSVMRSAPPAPPGCGADCPVVGVSWNQIQEFLRRLNAAEPGGRYRLPTEAEWEYAARAGSSTAYPWGDAPDCTRGNFGSGRNRSDCAGAAPGRPAPVASYPANAWGLHDMHGNALEWVQDTWSEYRPGLPAVDPAGPEPPAAGSSVRKVVRGGYWGGGADELRSAYRSGETQDAQSGWEGEGVLGFRVVREVPEGSAEDVRLPEEIVRQVPVFPRNVFVLAESERSELVLNRGAIPTHDLRETEVRGVWVSRRSGQETPFRSWWTLPPDVFAPGEEVRIEHGTDAPNLSQVKVTAAWAGSAFSVATSEGAGGARVSSFGVGTLKDRFSVRVVATATSEFEAGWVYRYEYTLY